MLEARNGVLICLLRKTAAAQPFVALFLWEDKGFLSNNPLGAGSASPLSPPGLGERPWSRCCLRTPSPALERGSSPQRFLLLPKLREGGTLLIPYDRNQQTCCKGPEREGFRSMRLSGLHCSDSSAV